MQKNCKKGFRLILKTAVAGIAFWFIYLKIKHFTFSDFTFPVFNFRSYLLFCFVLLLMPVNWFIETVKWKFLIRKLENLTFPEAFKAVLSGISFALISPNRIGELAGRVFILKKENRGKAVFVTAIGSLSQMLITVIVGLFSGISILFFYPELSKALNSDQLFYLKIVTLSSAVFGLLILFNLKYLVLILKKINLNIKFIKYIEILSEYSTNEVFKVLLLSLLRYVIFSSQFVLLLYFFDTELLFCEAFAGIALTYLLSSLVPVLSILEISVRGTAAIIFLGMFSQNIPGIVSAAAVLWIINLAVPAVAGSIIFYRTKI